ncbi:MAG: DUF2225 domain-containing protein [Fibrobacter sp.]|nr:DUF2225 domain-containing protein [Fibrobacter sp.]
MTIDIAEVKRRLQALLNDQNLVNDYVRKFGPSIDIKNIRTVRESRAQGSGGKEEGKKKEDPIYELKVTCPACRQRDIVSYEMKSKSQSVAMSKFLVPIYTGTTRFATVNYTLLAPAVCPRCLFASPDKKDFIRKDAAGGEARSLIPGNVIMALQERIDERKSLLRPGTDPKSYFKRPRSNEAAIEAYNLALARAKVEAYYDQPYSHFKMGAYNLRIAKILKDMKQDNTEALNMAIMSLEDAFKSSNCPSEELEMQTIYLLVALYLKIGDQKKASTYINVFQNLHGQRLIEMKEDPSLKANTITKWRDKAKYIWEDRDEPDLFKND